MGVLLAKEFNGEIISADSRQVYRGLDLGTGKEGTKCPQYGARCQESGEKLQTPNSHSSLSLRALPSESKTKLQTLRSCLRCVDGIPQWMIDIVEPETKFTLFDYLDSARIAIEDIFSRGKVPIIVGGTGLYVQGLVEGFELEQLGAGSQEPGAKTPKRQTPNPQPYTREQLDNLTTEQLKNILSSLNPEVYAVVDQKNPRRLIRAIEKAQSGERTTKVKPDFEVLQIGLDLPREELHKRIDRRVDERFKEGMLDEVVSLIKSDVSSEWLQSLGLEYRIITDFVISNSQFLISNQFSNSNDQKLKIKNSTLNKNLELKIKNYSEFAAMVQTLKWNIHQFARRQMTWFRRFPEIKWLSNYNDIRIATSKFISN